MKLFYQRRRGALLRVLASFTFALILNACSSELNRKIKKDISAQESESLNESEPGLPGGGVEGSGDSTDSGDDTDQGSGSGTDSEPSDGSTDGSGTTTGSTTENFSTSLALVGSSPTNDINSLRFRLELDEPTSDLNSLDFELMPIGQAAIEVIPTVPFGGGFIEYEIQLNPSVQNATYTLELKADSVQSIGGNFADPAVAGVTYDTSAPTASFQEPILGFESMESFAMTVVFSEPVTNFDPSDIQTINASISANWNSSQTGNVFSFSVTPSSQALVEIRIAAGASEDEAGNTLVGQTHFSYYYSIYKLLEADPVTTYENGGLGASVDIDGDTAIISQPGYLSLVPGTIYIFKKDEILQKWVQKQLFGGTPGIGSLGGIGFPCMIDGFSCRQDAVAVSGNIAVVVQEELVHILERPSPNQDFTISSIFSHNLFSMHDRMVVEIDESNIYLGIREGSPSPGYLFKLTKTAGQWPSDANSPGFSQITPCSNCGGSEFGYSIAIDEGRIIVGARRAHVTPEIDQFTDRTGRVFVYTTGLQDAGEIRMVTSTKPAGCSINSNEYPIIAEDAEFGFAVDISGDYVVASAPCRSGNCNNSGNCSLVTQEWGGDWVNRPTVHLFKKHPVFFDRWTRVDSLDHVQESDFGFDVEIDGDFVMIGAPGESKIYYYRIVSDLLVPISGEDALSVPENIDTDSLGATMKIDGGNILLGTPYNTDNLGGFLFYERPPQ